MTYSQRYRERVMKVKKEQNLTYEETSKLFGVTMRTLFRWKQNPVAKKTRNKPATKIDMEALRKDVEKYPDRYLYERAKDYGVSAWAIGLALRRLNISSKKKPMASQS